VSCMPVDRSHSSRSPNCCFMPDGDAGQEVHGGTRSSAPLMNPKTVLSEPGMHLLNKWSCR
jgi:hypothetical protein